MSLRNTCGRHDPRNLLREMTKIWHALQQMPLRERGQRMQDKCRDKGTSDNEFLQGTVANGGAGIASQTVKHRTYAMMGI